MQYSFTALLFSPLLFSTFDYNGCDAAMLCRTCWYGGSGGPSSGGRVTRSLCSTALAGPSSLTLLTHCAAPGMTCWPGMSCSSLPMPFTAYALHCLCPSLCHSLPLPFTAFALRCLCPSLLLLSHSRCRGLTHAKESAEEGCCFCHTADKTSVDCCFATSCTLESVSQ